VTTDNTRSTNRPTGKQGQRTVQNTKNSDIVFRIRHK